MRAISFNGNSSLQTSKGKNIDLSENAKYNFILDKQSLQHLLKKTVSKTSGSSDNASLVFEKY